MRREQGEFEKAVEALRTKEAELAAVQSDRESDQQAEAAERSELEAGPFKRSVSRLTLASLSGL